MRGKRTALIMLLLVALLVAGAGLWLRSERRQYALNRQLIAALVKGDNIQALALVNAGADPNTRYKPTPTPSLLQLARQLMHLSPPPVNASPIALSIACGEPWNDNDASWLVQSKRPDNSLLVQAMIRKGVRVNAQCKDGWTSLMWAVRDNRWNTVSVLIEQGAKVNAKSRSGVTPLMVGGNSPNSIRLLLQHGAEVNEQDDSGLTPLCSAVLYIHYSTKDSVVKDVIRQLLTHGANPNVVSKSGDTPLSFARYLERPDIVALLKQYGAKK